jgi:hypothetical protein
LWLDLKIILMTIKKVLVRDGINAAGEATMSRFTGSALTTTSSPSAKDES